MLLARTTSNAENKPNTNFKVTHNYRIRHEKLKSGLKLEALFQNISFPTFFDSNEEDCLFFQQNLTLSLPLLRTYSHSHTSLTLKHTHSLSFPHTSTHTRTATASLSARAAAAVVVAMLQRQQQHQRRSQWYKALIEMEIH